MPEDLPYINTAILILMGLVFANTRLQPLSFRVSGFTFHYLDNTEKCLRQTQLDQRVGASIKLPAIGNQKLEF